MRHPVPLLVNRENRREYRARLSRFPVCRECSNKQCRGHWGNGRGASPRGPTRIIQRPEARYRVGGILIENQPRITAAIYAKYPCLTTFAARRIELAASELKQRTEKKEEKTIDKKGSTKKEERERERVGGRVLYSSLFAAEIPVELIFTPGFRVILAQRPGQIKFEFFLGAVIMKCVSQKVRRPARPAYELLRRS